MTKPLLAGKRISDLKTPSGQFALYEIAALQRERAHEGAIFFPQKDPKYRRQQEHQYERRDRLCQMLARRLLAALEQRVAVVTEEHRLGGTWFRCPICDYHAVDQCAGYCGGCGARLEWRLEE